MKWMTAGVVMMLVADTPWVRREPLTSPLVVRRLMLMLVLMLVLAAFTLAEAVV